MPEGPFGDHLGYYSLAHDFPVLDVDAVYHRPGAIWPFTVVGRPPQEDTSFGELIHDLTGPILPTVIPGVHAVHAVDAAGVHPLLLAIGSERYVPYAGRRKPQELLTNANAILGQGQLSLAKYLLIAAQEDDPQLDINDVPAFFAHVLSRVDWTTDLHFQTCTTIDTLDYTSGELNAGSKLVIAAAGPPRRPLPTSVPPELRLPDGFANPRLCLPGILATRRSAVRSRRGRDRAGRRAIVCRRRREPSAQRLSARGARRRQPIRERLAEQLSLDDVHPLEPGGRRRTASGVLSATNIGAAADRSIIDARLKPHHAPPLVEDPAVSKSVDQLAAPGGPLHGIL